jgi:hypothetical protein
MEVQASYGQAQDEDRRAAQNIPEDIVEQLVAETNLAANRIRLAGAHPPTTML